MHNKKTLAMILSCSLLLASCASNGEDATKTTTNAVETTITETTKAETTTAAETTTTESTTAAETTTTESTTAAETTTTESTTAVETTTTESTTAAETTTTETTTAAETTTTESTTAAETTTTESTTAAETTTEATTNAAAGDLASMSLEDIANKLTEGIADMPMIDNMVVEPDYYPSYIFTDYIEGSSCLASEAMMSSVAHSIVLLRVPEGSDVAKIKSEIENNADPMKWVCTGAESVEVLSSGNLIVLVMSFEDIKNAVVDNFNNLNN